MVYCFIQCIDEFEEILFIQEYFMLLIAKIIAIYSSLALCYGQVVIISTG